MALKIVKMEKRHHTLKFISQYLPFGHGSFHGLRVVPEGTPSQKKFDLGRSPKIGQMRVIPNSREKIFAK